MNSESNTALDVANVVSPVMTRGKSKVPLPQWEWDNACDIKYWMIKLAGFIPEVGAILSTILEVCWPSKKENVWQQILHEVENMIETSKLTIIQGVLRGFINEMEGKVTHVQFMLETHPGSREAHDAYMSLARYLIGMEEHFCSFDDRTNLQIMPMYTASLMLQVMYWSIGVHKSQEMGLTAWEVEEMQDIIDRLVDRSSAYCHALYDTEYDEIINTSDAYDITNDLLSVRGHCLMHGIEVLEIVEQIKARGSKENIILKTLSYSEVFDRVTPKTKLQALTEDDNMVAPLKPAWLGNNYAQIRSLVGYIVRIGGAPRVGGLGITFTDGNTYQLGTITREYRNLELNGSVITLIETWGSGAIDEGL
ncbi:insecticidal delta-endotoxin Cry8Ea1 family protein [Sodalis sp.]|uniref:insecticidal delta-endotoxin Cry8Ea1 family protein n=1 Tax=Sodalis sp. (in: enterobacteria) TaxID=1898979 RepID=UPI003872C5C7